MSPDELATVTSELLGKQLTLTSGGLSETWIVRHVTWTGHRCSVKFHDGSRFHDRTLRDWTVKGAQALFALATVNLQAQLDDRAKAVKLDFSDLVGEELG